MSSPKTVPNDRDPLDYLNEIPDEKKRADAFVVLELMQKITGEKPVMWGPSIVGFGSYHYVYASGREGDWPLCGFSAPKTQLTLHLMSGFSMFHSHLQKLGKHKTGKSCLYIKRLSDVDLEVLETLVRESVSVVKKRHKE